MNENSVKAVGALAALAVIFSMAALTDLDTSAAGWLKGRHLIAHRALFFGSLLVALLAMPEPRHRGILRSIFRGMGTGLLVGYASGVVAFLLVPTVEGLGWRGMKSPFEVHQGWMMMFSAPFLSLSWLAGALAFAIRNCLYVVLQQVLQLPPHGR
ncbi:hypothetical protein [Myxococcus sp. RHSTA-1-4]|uniref:hypothetical protein n=1 Tax=Myxococcus sp. RHSTA-1-4 TaxID=2874601 RepID=UPI001CBD6F35|nr:hypothetical protein [Myxococcus sp. RHSTA-1-4]MBZ4417793.1 hypothetical protein [Myxococcus sp. RHSTA-1-4]